MEESKVWDLLLKYQAPEPPVGYKGAFWARVVKPIAHSPQWQLTLARSLTTAFAAGFMVIVVISINQYQIDARLTQLPDSDVQMITHLDLATNLDLLEDFDAVVDLDVIEQMDEEVIS